MTKFLFSLLAVSLISTAALAQVPEPVPGGGFDSTQLVEDTDEVFAVLKALRTQLTGDSQLSKIVKVGPDHYTVETRRYMNGGTHLTCRAITYKVSNGVAARELRDGVNGACGQVD